MPWPRPRSSAPTSALPDNLLKQQGGGTASPQVELAGELAEGFNVLVALHKDSGEAVGAKAFAEAMELDKQAAAKMLEKLAKAGVATMKGRGRGKYYTPAGEVTP